MLIIVDGPEKAGKTTLIRRLVETIPHVQVRYWRPVKSDREYLYALQEDVTRIINRWPHHVVVWDRSWASEHVYCNLLKRDGRLKEDPFFGEWVYGRIASAIGMKLMLTGPSWQILRDNRESDDHPVDPQFEVAWFKEYGHSNGWTVLHSAYTEEFLNTTTDLVIEEMGRVRRWVNAYRAYPPLYAGAVEPEVLVLGEPPTRVSLPVHRDNWVPFGSRLTTQLGRDLEPESLEYGWSNIGWCPLKLIDDAEVVVACGKVVQKYVRNYASAKTMISVPHPAWLYRYGDGLDIKERTIETLKGEIKQWLKKK